MDRLDDRSYQVSRHWLEERERTMEPIGAAKFKEQCLGLTDGLAPEGLVITRGGRPVARALPYSEDRASLIGSLRDKIRVRVARSSRRGSAGTRMVSLDTHILIDALGGSLPVRAPLRVRPAAPRALPPHRRSFIPPQVPARRAARSTSCSSSRRRATDPPDLRRTPWRAW